jgi:putative ABC transport system ATP-binding protein
MHDGAHHGPPPHRRLFALLKPEAADIGLVVLFSIITGFLYLASPLAVDALVNNISFGGQQPVYLQSLLILAGVLLVFLLALAVVSTVQYFVVELIQQRIFVRLAADFSCRLPRLQYGALERTQRPELVNKFLDVVTVQKSSAYLMLDGVNVVLATAIGLLVLAFYHPFLLAFDLVLIVGLVVVLIPMGRRGVDTSIQESYAKHAVAGWLEQVVMFPLLFKNASAAAFSRDRTDHLVDSYISARRAHFRILIRQILGLLGLEAIASAMLLALGGLLVLQGQLTLGQLVASELIVSAIVASIVRLGKHLENWYDSLAAIDKLGSVVDLPVEREGGQNPTRVQEPSTLEVEEVSFSYPGSRPLFENVNLSVRPGEHVAITGPIGSGAGTFLDLIYGLRSPSEGLIRVRGVDVRSWDLLKLRQEVALVREPEFIDGTLAENMRMGGADLEDSEIQQMLDQVGLGKALSRLPDGLELRLRPGGRPLSDSQRILVALARVLASRPRLLMIDKVLDGLDAHESEAILSLLFSPGQPWTLVVATRDEQILERCDRVYRLHPKSAGDTEASPGGTRPAGDLSGGEPAT